MRRGFCNPCAKAETVLAATSAVVRGVRVLHDGYTDLLYVLLPLWCTEFALGYAAVGLLQAFYRGHGLISDAAGVPMAMGIIDGAVLTTLPLACTLHPFLPPAGGGGAAR